SRYQDGSEFEVVGLHLFSPISSLLWAERDSTAVMQLTAACDLHHMDQCGHRSGIESCVALDAGRKELFRELAQPIRIKNYERGAVPRNHTVALKLIQQSRHCFAGSPGHTRQFLMSEGHGEAKLGLAASCGGRPLQQ